MGNVGPNVSQHIIPLHRLIFASGVFSLDRSHNFSYVLSHNI